MVTLLEGALFFNSFSEPSFLLQHTIDEVENLIKKHEAFEKSAAAQEERFGALERLTTVCHFLIVNFHCRIVRLMTYAFYYLIMPLNLNVVVNMYFFIAKLCTVERLLKLPL